ncbi:MAG: hypothetical protein NWE93_06560 [Candidatus Bathyarchaeota archaeon]|nr:hypothetical protein [Candidatus Bathyarchaeota archaeon]
MSEEAVRKVLQDFGLTEKETDIYIFVAKHGVLKGGEVAKQTHTSKALVYRILKSLQEKGIVESTLEFPARFSAVPFEEVIDLNVKSKLSEASRLEGEKKLLLSHWKQVDRPEAALSVERFAVINGKQKVYRKLSQMVKQTNTVFSSIITSRDLAQANCFGVFDENPKGLRSGVDFRFLVGPSNQNLDAARKLLSDLEARIPEVQLRMPEVGAVIFPQMAIRDKEEAMFHITPKDQRSEKGDDMVLWTNCKSLIDAFSVLFEDSWQNSVVLHKQRTGELEEQLFPEKIEVIDDSDAALKKYREAIRSSQKEIIMVTSCETPSEVSRTKEILTDLVQENVDIKLMVPITSNNKAILGELSKHYSVRHVPVGCLATSIIDGKHLFQFKNAPSNSELLFEETFYTTDSDCVSKTRRMLTDMWEHAQVPSATTIQSILQEVDPQLSSLPRCPPNAYGSPFVINEKPAGSLIEKDVMDKMIIARNNRVDIPPGVIDRRYGSIGLAVIHPPPYLKLPDLMIVVNKIEKQSSLGEEDAIIFLSWLQTPKGAAYLPVAIIGDNPKSHEFWKCMNQRNPAGKNTYLLNKEEIEIRIHGNNLFADWTVPVPLFPPQYTLPPACVLIEGYGEVKTAAYTVAPPSGYRILREENYLDAFVTFFHQSTKYSGPGTDGYLIRDSIITIFSPETGTA